MTTVAPVGVAKRYDITKPMIKLITTKIALAIVTLLKFLKTVLADRVGKMIRLEIKRAPINLIPSTINTEQRIAKIVL